MNITRKVRVLNFFRNAFRIPRMESFLALQTRGKNPRHPICKLVPNPYQYPSPSFRTINRNGIVMTVDVSDYVGHYLYFGFRDKGMDQLFSMCRQDSIVLDVGTNIGWTVLNLARIAKVGTVIGFEPDPYNFEQCTANIKRNGMTNIQVFPVGLGDSKGTAAMEVRTPSNRGGNRIAPNGSPKNYSIEIVRLDEFAPVDNLPRIDLVKLDVEGFELHVLRGAVGMLANHKPALFIELDDNNLREQGDSAIELIRFLDRAGYDDIRHAETGVPVSTSNDFVNCHFDIIAK